MIYRILPLITLCALLSGCCKEEYRFAGDIAVSLVENTSALISTGLVADTLRGPFRYAARLGYDQFSEGPTFRPAQVLLAFSCDETYDRILDRASVRVTLDRGITFDDLPLPAGTDLVELLAGIPDLDTDGTVFSQDVELRVGTSFLERAAIPPGRYTFTFEGQLDDGTPVAQATAVYLDL